MKLRIVIWFALCVLVTMSCADDDGSGSISDNNRPLLEGELCRVFLDVDSLSGFEEEVTRGSAAATYEKITRGEKCVELGLKVSAGTRLSTGAMTRAATGVEIFGAGSRFRLLAFAGEYGTNLVNMDSPTHNVVCKVNDNGTGARVIEPDTILELPKGDYKFICFPADEKFNTWTVGKSAEATGCNKVTVASGIDFACLTTETVSLNTLSHRISLRQFTRTGYILDVGVSLEGDGELTAPASNISLTISGDSTGAQIINRQVEVNLVNKVVSKWATYTVTATVPIVAGPPQTFSRVSYFLLSNPAASQRLKINYPAFTISTIYGNVDIPAGNYVSGSKYKFLPGYLYKVTLGIDTSLEEGGGGSDPGGGETGDGNLFFTGKVPAHRKDSTQYYIGFN